MSLCDPYRELELYLEKANDEITKVFEHWAPPHYETVKYADKIVDNDNIQSEWDLDPILLHFDDIIDTDIKELFARYEENCKNIVLKHSEYSQTNFDSNESDVLADELNGSTSTIFQNDPTQIFVNETATQTSPSLSESSTNLTWLSDRSSSPCLTCASDADAADDESLSASSADSIEDFMRFRQWQQELNAKSSSAPVLKKVVTKVNKQQYRSQSDRHLAEIEATEACKWLRAAGFPQYAQMYEDMQFPVDVLAAAQDHPLLEPAVLHSLFRRLQTLNRCARVHQRIIHTDDSEDEQCALSDNWTYQTASRRWSRNVQNVQLSNIQEATSKEWWCGSLPHDKNQSGDDQLLYSPKDKLRRAGSTKYRRRRDGIIISDSSSDVLDVLSKQLDSISATSTSHMSDSECTSSQNRRRRTRSVDKTDTWSNQPSTTSTFWQTIPKGATTNGEYISLNLENLKSGYPISHLSCTQLQVLRKLALLKLTAHMEKYCPTHRSTGWNWDLPKFIRKMKAPIYREKTIFGVPLTVNVQRTGLPLPKCIEETLIWLQQNAYDQVGLFRKSGVKSRIHLLRNMLEMQRDDLNLNEHQAYDVADVVKQYFRELPEALLTNKFSETLILIFQYIPPFLRREAVLCTLLLIPNEHVEVLKVVLNFLMNIAKHAGVNQMTESNLAICFAPSLFHYSQSSSRQGSPHPKELVENKASQECLLYLLKNYQHLFNIPKELINQCKVGEMRDTKAVQLTELGDESSGGWRGYLYECQSALLKEARDKSRGWIPINSHFPKVEISYKKIADGHPLRLWRLCAEIEAPPSEVLHRLLRERHVWDLDLQLTKTVSQVDNNCEVYQYVRKNLVTLPNEEYCVVRLWKNDLPKDACLIVETSVEHPDAVSIPNSVRGIVLASRYLIEPCGSGKSRLLHLSRVDTRGRMTEWYHKNYGHTCAIFISNIVNSFQRTAAGPESKV